jgi:hypothetical protein
MYNKKDKKSAQEVKRMLYLTANKNGRNDPVT